MSTKVTDLSAKRNRFFAQICAAYPELAKMIVDIYDGWVADPQNYTVSAEDVNLNADIAKPILNCLSCRDGDKTLAPEDRKIRHLLTRTEAKDANGNRYDAYYPAAEAVSDIARWRDVLERCSQDIDTVKMYLVKSYKASYILRHLNELPIEGDDILSYFNLSGDTVTFAEGGFDAFDHARCLCITRLQPASATARKNTKKASKKTTYHSHVPVEMDPIKTAPAAALPEEDKGDDEAVDNSALEPDTVNGDDSSDGEATNIVLNLLHRIGAYGCPKDSVSLNPYMVIPNLPSPQPYTGNANGVQELVLSALADYSIETIESIIKTRGSDVAQDILNTSRDGFDIQMCRDYPMGYRYGRVTSLTQEGLAGRQRESARIAYLMHFDELYEAINRIAINDETKGYNLPVTIASRDTDTAEYAILTGSRNLPIKTRFSADTLIKTNDCEAYHDAMHQGAISGKVDPSSRCTIITAIANRVSPDQLAHMIDALSKVHNVLVVYRFGEGYHNICVFPTLIENNLKATLLFWETIRNNSSGNEIFVKDADDEEDAEDKDKLVIYSSRNVAEYILARQNAVDDLILKAGCYVKDILRHFVEVMAPTSRLVECDQDILRILENELLYNENSISTVANYILSEAAVFGRKGLNSRGIVDFINTKSHIEYCNLNAPVDMCKIAIKSPISVLSAEDCAVVCAYPNIFLLLKMLDSILRLYDDRPDIRNVIRSNYNEGLTLFAKHVEIGVALMDIFNRRLSQKLPKIASPDITKEDPRLISEVFGSIISIIAEFNKILTEYTIKAKETATDYGFAISTKFIERLLHDLRDLATYVNRPIFERYSCNGESIIPAQSAPDSDAFKIAKNLISIELNWLHTAIYKISVDIQIDCEK